MRAASSTYWGYNPIAWFAPANEYAVEDAVREFKGMVRALHRAEIEVILDVVFNHTAEGGETGPVLCFKGIDNAAYYRLTPDGASATRTSPGAAIPSIASIRPCAP